MFNVIALPPTRDNILENFGHERATKMTKSVIKDLISIRLTLSSIKKVVE